MNRFEDLPNETLMEIFEYLDARDLYRAFYNLNLRFNIVLQSLNELCLILSSSDRKQITSNTIFLPYVQTLIIKYRADIILNYYPNIRRLILFWLPYKFETGIFPYLEYLSINLQNSSFSLSLNRLHDIIFSNGFPSLKYCFLPKQTSIHKTQRWTQLLSLRILKIGSIGLFTYVAILSTCPNLNFLYFFEQKVLQTSTFISQYVKHDNLKRLVIEDKSIEIGVLNEYLSCISKLEYLSIHLTRFCLKNLKYLQEFDWFISILSLHLPLLRQFRFHLPIICTRKSNNLNTFIQIEEWFKSKTKDRYHSQLFIHGKDVIDQSSSSDSSESEY